MDSIEIESNIEQSTPQQNNEVTVLESSNKPQQISYEALIPISLDKPISKSRPKIVEETVLNIRNIIELSPNGLIDTLNIQARKSLENEVPTVNISCCSSKEVNEQKTAAIDVTVILPYEVDDSDTAKFEVPIVFEKDANTMNINTSAIRKILIESLESSTLEEDLSSFTTHQPNEPSSNKEPVESSKINIKIPVETPDRRQQTKINIKNSIIQGVKDAIKTGIEEQDAGNEVVRINTEKGPNVDLPTVQTSCCTRDEITNNKIIDVKIQLKSKNKDNITSNILLEKFVANPLDQEPILNENIFDQALDQHISKVVDNIDFEDETAQNQTKDSFNQQLGNINEELSNDILDILEFAENSKNSENNNNPQTSLQGSSQISDQEGHNKTSQNDKDGKEPNTPLFGNTKGNNQQDSINNVNEDTNDTESSSSEQMNSSGSQDDKNNGDDDHNFQSFPPFKFNITVSSGKEPITAGEIPNNVNGNVPNILKPIIGLRPSSSLRPQEQQPDPQGSDGNDIDVKINQQSTSNTIKPSGNSEPSDGNGESSGDSTGLLARIRDVILALAATLMVQNISGGLPLGGGGPARKGDTNVGDEPFSVRPNPGFSGIGGGNRPFIVKDPNVRKTLQESNAFFDGTSLNFTIPVEVSTIIFYYSFLLIKVYYKKPRVAKI